jgi:hypothetical protein
MGENVTPFSPLARESMCRHVRGTKRRNRSKRDKRESKNVSHMYCRVLHMHSHVFQYFCDSDSGMYCTHACMYPGDAVTCMCASFFRIQIGQHPLYPPTPRTPAPTNESRKQGLAPNTFSTRPTHASHSALAADPSRRNLVTQLAAVSTHHIPQRLQFVRVERRTHRHILGALRSAITSSVAASSAIGEKKLQLFFKFSIGGEVSSGGLRDGEDCSPRAG